MARQVLLKQSVFTNENKLERYFPTFSYKMSLRQVVGSFDYPNLHQGPQGLTRSIIACLYVASYKSERYRGINFLNFTMYTNHSTILKNVD